MSSGCLYSFSSFSSFIFPDVLKSATSIPVSIKSKGLRITFDKKLVRWKRRIQLTFSKNYNTFLLAEIKDLNLTAKEFKSIVKNLHSDLVKRLENRDIQLQVKI